MNDTPANFARERLRDAWPLFQVCLPSCLPLAVVGVAASAVPAAEAAAMGRSSNYLQQPEWWGIYLASTVLMLVCFAAVLRLQWSISTKQSQRWLDALKDSLRGLVPTAGVVILSSLIIVPALLLLIVPGLAALVLLLLGWHIQLFEQASPWNAIRRSVARVRPVFMKMAMLVLMMLAAIVVFVLMAGILMDLLTNLAGPGFADSKLGVSLSRWLMATVVALPVVYVAAVTTVVYQASRNASGQASG